VTISSTPSTADRKLTSSFIEALNDFRAQATPGVPWEEFGRVPWAIRSANWRDRLGHCWEQMVLERYSYLTASPLHEFCLRRLERRAGRRAATLFRFLCLCETIETEEASELFGERNLEAWRSAGLFATAGDRLALAVRLVPYRDYCYVTEAGDQFRAGTPGNDLPYLGDQTHKHIQLVKGFLRRHFCRRLLDMGCGIGMAVLEARPWAAVRLGVDLSVRSLEFARINQQWRADADVVFQQSDLFENVSGEFDLILFNPWQPSEAAAPLLLRFLRDLPRYLTPHGTAVVTVDSLLAGGRDTVLTALCPVLAEQSMVARRQIFASYRDERDERGRGVAAGSVLWISRSTSAAQPPIRMVPGLEASKFWLKRKLNDALDQIGPQPGSRAAI
jgi:SAM-dependent methyltransferase